jgi:hypothetical protein
VTPRRLNLYAFLLSISAISYWHVKKCHELPWPPQFIYTAITFALLDIFSLFNEEIAGVTSIGFVIAIFVKQGWIADCEHGGTGQPQTTAYLGSNQPPSTASLQDYQGQSGQTSGTTGQGGNTVV